MGIDTVILHKNIARDWSVCPKNVEKSMKI